MDVEDRKAWGVLQGIAVEKLDLRTGLAVWFSSVGFETVRLGAMNGCIRGKGVSAEALKVDQTSDLGCSRLECLEKPELVCRV